MILSAALKHWRDRKATRAAKYLTSCRIRREREEVRRVARQLCTEMNKEVPRILRG